MQALVPTLSFPACLRLQARSIRAAIFDVDGVLTDGTLYISEAGETLKAFHALDGHGLKLLARGGITPVVITGRDSPAVRRRLKDLGIVHAGLLGALLFGETLGLDALLGMALIVGSGMVAARLKPAGKPPATPARSTPPDAS